MADDIYIIIKTLLEKASPEEVAKLQKDIQARMQPVKVKIDADAKSLDKFTQTTKQALGEVENISERTKEWTQSLGIMVKETERINKNTGQIDETVRKLNINYKEMDKIHGQALAMNEKINQKIKEQQINAEKIHHQALLMNQKIDTQRMDSLHKQALLENKLRDTQRSEIDAAIQQTILNKKKEQTVWTEKQFIAINKNIEQEKKVTAELQNQLNLYKQKMLGGSGFRGELDIFAEKKSGKYDKNVLSQLRVDIENLNTNTPELNNKIKQTGAQFNLLKKEASEASSVITRTFENLFKFMRFYLVGGTFVKLLSSLRQGVETLHQIDDALISIAKVTEYTKKEMEELVITGINVSKEYGRSVQDYLSAVTEFSRAGFGQEAQRYAELSLLLQNVGDITAEVANETLIATNAGFQLGGSYEALMEVIDKFNNVSNLNATNIDKMSQAMKVGAATFHSAGLSIDETVALIGTATASTQRAGAEVSRAFRTILMNIRQIKDEEAEVTEESMANAEKALNAIGIVVRDTPNTYRPMFDILRDLGNAFENLTPVQQAFTAESLANKRQADILISTLQNWNTVEKQLNESIGSSGSALRENEIYLQSWSAATSRLSSSLTSLYNNFLDTNSIISFINLMDKIVITLDNLINNQFSSAIIQIGIMTTALVLFGKLGNLIYGTNIIQWIVQVYALNTAKIGLTATTIGLTKAMLASPLFKLALVSIAIYGFIKLVNSITTSLEKQKKVVEELSTEINKLDTEYQQLKALENRTEAQEAYLKLLEAEIALKEKLLKIKYEKLIQEKYLDIKDIEFDTAPGAIVTSEEQIRYKTGLDEVYDEINVLKDLEEQLKKIAIEMDNASKSGDVDELEKLGKEYDDLKEKISEVRLGLIDYQKDFKKYIELMGDDANPAIVAVSDVIDVLIESMGVLADSSNATSKALQDTLSKSDKTIKSYQSALKELDNTGKLSISTMISMLEANEDLINYIGDEIELRKQIEKALEDEKNTAKKVIAEKLFANEEYYTKLKKENATYINKLSEDYGIDLTNFESLSKTKLKVEQHLLTQLSEMWANYSNLTTDHAKKLLAALEHDAKVFGIDPTQVQGYNLLKQLAEIDKVFEDFSLEGIEIDFNSSTSGKDIKEIAQYLSDDLAKAIDKVNGLLTASNVKSSQYDEASEEYRKEIQYQIDLQKQLQSLYHQGANELRARNEEIKQSTLFQKDWNSLTNEQKEKLNELKKELYDNEKAIQSFGNSWWSAQSAIDSANISLEKSIEEQRKLNEEQIKKRIDIGINLINREIEALQRLKDRAKETAEAQIKVIQDKIDRLESTNDLLKEQEEREKRLYDLAKQRERLENLKKERNVRMITATGEVFWIASPKLIADETQKLEDMQKDYYKWEEDIRHQKEIQRLKDQITAIQEALKNEERRYDRQIKNLQDFIKEYQYRESEFYGEQILGLDSLISEIMSMEGLSYDERIILLAHFVEEYNALIAKMKMAPALPVGPGGGSSGTGNYYTILDAYGNNVSVPEWTNDYAQEVFNNIKDGMSYNDAMNKANNDMNVYHTGGIVGSSINSKDAKTVNDLFQTKNNEQLIKALKNEVVVNPTLGMPNFLSNIRDLVSRVSQPAVSSRQQVFHIGKLEFPNVRTAEEVKRAIIDLPRVTIQYANG